MAMAGIPVFRCSGGNCRFEKCLHFRLGLGQEAHMNPVATGSGLTVKWRLNPEFGIGLAEGCGTFVFHEDPASQRAQHPYIKLSGRREVIGSKRDMRHDGWVVVGHDRYPSSCDNHYPTAIC